MGKIISRIEKILTATEERPVLRALIMPAIITHLIPLPIPASFLMFVALPAFIGREIARNAFHSSHILFVSVVAIIADVIIYGICVLICIPLTSFLLQKLLYFVGVTDGIMNIVGVFAKDVLSKMNRRVNEIKK